MFQENQELFIVFGVLVLLCLIFLILNIRFFLVGKCLNRLLKGSNSENLEAILREAVESNKAMEKHLVELQDLCEKLQETAAESLQNIGLVRFNAFPDMGGDLSFALALLNAQGNGVVLCSLVGRDDCRIYTKSVVRGRSPYQLSDEEKLAIKKALDKDTSIN